MKDITYGSVCSGIEAVSVAWQGMGFEPAWFSEIEPFQCAVLAHHYPSVPNYGDMTTLPERILSGEIEAPDILVGGTPCQAFSVAGLRNSLNDERGNLTLVFVRILNAINTIRRRYGLPDAVVLWENVPGVLSTRDNAFGCFLAALLGESKELVPTRGRWTGAGIVRSDECEIAWRILDAQYFGVPQRRRRVFLVAGSRNRRIAEILFEQPGESRNFEQGEKKEKESAAFIESGFGTYRKSDVGGTVKRTGGALSGGSETLIVNIGATLSTGFGGRGVDSGQICNGNCVINSQKVRKLTPVECERLQGFPDNYTRIPWRNKPAEQCPDTPRYMAIGNSMAVPVMRWIGERICGT
jgi:cytosine-specific methyltransferase|nr:MAG TPA: Cytosine specific methyltransferase [Caudoviricetes sp.]